MKNQKHWEDEELEPLDEVPKVKKFEVVLPFKHNHEQIMPGDEMPDGVSDLAIDHLLNRGCIKPL